MITKEQELSLNVVNWRSKPLSYRGQTIHETASWFQESDQKIDYYFFDDDKDGDWVSEGFKAKKSARRDTYLGYIEGLALDRLEDAKKNGEELFFWISRPHPDRGPDLKVIVTEAVQHSGRKRWLNRSLLFNFDNQKESQFITDLIKLSKNKPSFEDIRANPLIMDSNQDWIENLAKAAENPRIAEIIKTGQDEVDQQEALSRAERFYDQILGVPSIKLTIQQPAALIKEYQIGPHIGPCPPRTAFEMVYARAMPVGVSSAQAEECQEIKCSGCGWKPKGNQLQQIQDGRLTSCPDCGRAP